MAPLRSAFWRWDSSFSPNPGAPPSAEEQEVQVRPGSFTQITIAYDSGVR